MIARLVSRTRLSDLNDGAVGKQILAAGAREVEDVHVQVAGLLDLLDPDTMTGSDLDSYALIVQPDGVAPRHGATYATGAVLLATVGGVAVPVRRDYLVAAGSVQFQTTAACTIPPAGSILVAIRAVEAGSAGNVGPATITTIVTSQPGVDSVTNPVALTNGEDEESDDEFRGRIKAYQRSLARCTPGSLEYLAKSIGVTTHADSSLGAITPGDPILVYTDATPVVRRVRFAQIVEDLTFRGLSDLYIDDGTGFTGVAAAQLVSVAATGGAPETLTAAALGGERRFRTAYWPIDLASPFTLLRNGAALVEGVNFTINRSNGRIVLATGLTIGDTLRISAYTASLDLVRAVQIGVEGDLTDPETWPGWRAAGTVVYVRRATTYPTNVTALIAVLGGYDPVDVADAVETAVTAFLATHGIGQNVLWSQVAEIIMAVDGVDNLYSLTVGGGVAPGDDLPVPDGWVARAGTIAVTY
jgi:uncharacterized phage protein gp47/JayE